LETGVRGETGVEGEQADHRGRHHLPGFEGNPGKAPTEDKGGHGRRP
jgi:hypothetical protein